MEANKATKVTQVESYKDSQGSHLVVKGKLVLTGAKQFDKYINPLDIKPLIISETEKIEVGDKRYNPILKCITNRVGKDDYKILALPEQFSPKHLQAIIDGKLKDGDEVYVECEKHCYDSIGNIFVDKGSFAERNNIHISIKLTNNHIKLFPVKKEETTWSHIWIDWIKHNEQFKTDVSFSLWLQDNYNPPSKK